MQIIISFSNSNKTFGMLILRTFKQLIKKGDFFNSFQMLRYQKETEYRTFTGGLISVGIIVTIIIAFASMILDTINRTTINFTQNSLRFTDPLLSTLVASSDSNFMFGVEVWGYNLSSNNRLFDVVFNQIQSNFGANYTYTPYPLQQCTKEHWAMLPDVISKFDTLHVGNWLCPTIGTIIKLQGKYTSQFYNQFSVTLYPCNNNTDPSRPCGTPQEIDQFFIDNGQWNYFSFYYVNTIVNPAQPEYKSFYLEDRSFISFGNEMGAEMDLYLSQIDIESDNSIWPFQDLQEDKVYNIPFSPILYPYKVDNGTSYADFYIIKDPTQYNYSRAVQKIFVVFSFMGGLIGAVMAGLFIINSYTSFAYELALALQLFQESQHSNTHKQLKQEHKATINLIHYIKYYVYLVVRKIIKHVDWPFTKYIHQCREEIHQQLDIKGLLKRLIFLQYAMSIVLDDFHFSEMQLERPAHPSEIKALREKIQSKEGNSEDSSESVSIKNEVLAYGNCNSIAEKQQPCKQEVDLKKRKSTMHNYIHDSENIDPKPQEQANAGIPVQPEATDRAIFEVPPRLPGKKQTVHRKKLRQSARQGDRISKNLLRIVMEKEKQRKENSSQSAISEIENASFNSLNRKQRQISIKRLHE